MPVRRVLGALEAALVGPPARMWLGLLARRAAARPRAARPAVLWGVAPLINNKYHSEAIRRRGYDSATLVTDLYHNTEREDFDFHASEVLAGSWLLGRLPPRLRRRLEPYWLFAWAIERYDVFVFYASSTMLRGTPLQFAEFQLLRAAGKRTILLAYGADVQVNARSRNLLFKHVYGQDYPDYVRLGARVERELTYGCEHADYVLSGCDWVDHMPWWDGLSSGHFSIDTEQWRPPDDGEAPARSSGEPVVVLHAPNHRELKGTRFLISACEALRAEGVNVELRLVERAPNREVRRQMREADIIADQFVVGWYAMFAIEGMSMGKPVLCYLRDDLMELYSLYSYAAECPLVNTPPNRIADVLRDLVADAERRRELGQRGREYVEAHHSLEAAGGMFDDMLTALWPATT